MSLSPWQDPPARCLDVAIERNVVAPMRDGILLSADVYRPTMPGPWPVLLMRHPYDKTQAENVGFVHPIWYARYGYMVVVQDCRGRWMSQGDWYPFRDEAADGADSVAWAAGLPGSNGQVAMYGYSYAGATQWQAALQRPPQLATIMPAMTSADYYDNWTYRGGALHYAFTRFWALVMAPDTAARRRDYAHEADIFAALRSAAAGYWSFPADCEVLSRGAVAPYYFDWLRHDTYDDYWKQWAVRGQYDRVSVPALHIGGWYDIFLAGTLENFAGMQQHAGSAAARRQQKLVIGPWFHNPWHQYIGGLDFGAPARSCIDALQVLWLDKHLRGQSNQLDSEPPVAVFVMGENRWRFEEQWPPAGVRPTTWYLRSGGRANSLNGNGRLALDGHVEEPPDVYVYDPRNPVMSIGGHSCCNDQLTPMGAFDQRPQEVRTDVLVYTSEVLTAALRIVGAVEATIYAASTASDTDFTAKLVDVHPDGRAFNLAEGIVRARFRDSLETPTPIVPDRVYAYRIDLGSTAHVFQAGHCIRLEVSSSNFPAFERNSNSGKPLMTTGPADWVVATQTVFHDQRYASRLVLPVLPA